MRHHACPPKRRRCSRGETGDESSCRVGQKSRARWRRDSHNGETKCDRRLNAEHRLSRGKPYREVSRVVAQAFFSVAGSEPHPLLARTASFMARYVPKGADKECCRIHSKWAEEKRSFLRHGRQGETRRKASLHLQTGRQRERGLYRLQWHGNRRSNRGNHTWVQNLRSSFQPASLAPAGKNATLDESVAGSSRIRAYTFL